MYKDAKDSQKPVVSIMQMIHWNPAYPSYKFIPRNPADLLGFWESSPDSRFMERIDL